MINWLNDRFQIKVLRYSGRSASSRTTCACRWAPARSCRSTRATNRWLRSPVSIRSSAGRLAKKRCLWPRVSRATRPPSSIGAATLASLTNTTKWTTWSLPSRTVRMSFSFLPSAEFRSLLTTFSSISSIISNKSSISNSGISNNQGPDLYAMVIQLM